MPLFSLIVIPMFEDNYCYYVHPENDLTQGFYVDLAEPQKVTKF
jgi:hypothetical protein